VQETRRKFTGGVDEEAPKEVEGAEKVGLKIIERTYLPAFSFRRKRLLSVRIHSTTQA
jgi:hypothetical protein